MTKEQRLEQQLADMKAAKNRLLNTVADAPTWNEKRKAEVFDRLCPYVKKLVDKAINGDTSESCHEVNKVIVDQLLVGVLGDKALQDLEKL